MRLDDEMPARLAFFLAGFALIALWEVLAARREQAVGRRERWPANLGVAALDAVLVRLIFPAAAVGVAWAADVRGWGLLNQVELPAWAGVVVAVALLDLVVYGQHVVLHAVPLLWRFHMMHHADPEFDVTTGIRFHPVEILLSMGIKAGAVTAFGLPVDGVLAFEVLLNLTSMFNHGNIRIPAALDRVARWLVVTPDMHRVHHSVDAGEYNRNFGFNLPWWDRLFGTYRDQPAAGHHGMTIGVDPFRRRRPQTLGWLLVLPFARPEPASPDRHRERTVPQAPPMV